MLGINGQYQMIKIPNILMTVLGKVGITMTRETNESITHPEEVTVGLFKDRMKQAHINSQYGYMMIKLQQPTSSGVIHSIRTILRKVDSICEVDPYTIILMLDRLHSAEGMIIVVDKIRRKLGNVDTVKLSGIFVPTPVITFDGLRNSLNAMIDDEIKVKTGFGDLTRCDQCTTDEGIGCPHHTVVHACSNIGKKS